MRFMPGQVIEGKHESIAPSEFRNMQLIVAHVKRVNNLSCFIVRISLNSYAVGNDDCICIMALLCQTSKVGYVLDSYDLVAVRA